VGVLLAAGGEIDTTLGFLVPRYLSSATLRAQVNPAAPPVEYQLTFAPPGSLGATSLDVIVLGIELVEAGGGGRELVVSARLFNPHGQAVSLQPGDVFAIYSPEVLEDTFPVGPAVQPSGVDLPLVVRRGEALDVPFHFAWDGEQPFVGVDIGGYRYVAVLR
jgi:hypothetical protein